MKTPAQHPMLTSPQTHELIEVATQLTPQKIQNSSLTGEMHNLHEAQFSFYATEVGAAVMDREYWLYDQRFEDYSHTQEIQTARGKEKVLMLMHPRKVLYQEITARYQQYCNHVEKLGGRVPAPLGEADLNIAFYQLNDQRVQYLEQRWPGVKRFAEQLAEATKHIFDKTMYMLRQEGMFETIEAETK